MSDRQLSLAMNRLVRVIEFGPFLPEVNKNVASAVPALEDAIATLTGETNRKQLEVYLGHMTETIRTASKINKLGLMKSQTLQRRLESISTQAKKVAGLMEEVLQLGAIHKRHLPDYSTFLSEEEIKRLMEEAGVNIRFPSGCPVPNARYLSRSELAHLNPLWAASVLNADLAESAKKQLASFKEDFAKYSTKSRPDLHIIACSIYLLWKHSPNRVQDFSCGQHGIPMKLFELVCNAACIERTGEDSYFLSDAKTKKGAFEWRDKSN
jgi:hypothetical protein